MPIDDHDTSMIPLSTKDRVLLFLLFISPGLVALLIWWILS